MDIREVFQRFQTDEECLQDLQDMRWPDGVIRCPQCGCKDIERYERPAHEPKRRSKDRNPEKENKRRWFFICKEKTCRYQFSPTSGTLFHDTKLPLIVWFHAVALMLNAKKGISACQLQRDLKIGGYKTAWYLNHRIREAMREGSLPLLGGVVEIDETYLGGRQRGHQGKLKNKDSVVGLRQRKGPLRFIHTADVKGLTLKRIMEQNLSPDVELVMTDDSSTAGFALKGSDKHHVIKHSIGEYVRGEVHTNTIESAFSLLKRGIVGNFHRVSIKHLQKYLNEFTYRFNRRKDANAFIETIRRLAQFPPLTFAALTSDPSTPTPEPF